MAARFARVNAAMDLANIAKKWLLCRLWTMMLCRVQTRVEVEAGNTIDVLDDRNCAKTDRRYKGNGT